MPPNIKGTWNLNRREFLSAATIGTLGSFFLPELTVATLNLENTHVFRLSRDLDLLQLEVHFIRFKKTALALEPLRFGDSLVALRFPPQNLAEAIFDEDHKNISYENDPVPTDQEAPGNLNKEGKNSPKPPITSFLSGPSWMVFQIRDQSQFPLQDVECWFEILSTCNLKVPRGALPPNQRGKYVPVPPRPDETRLEIPYRLYISPEPDVRSIFSKVSRAPLSDQFGEMWQVALESRHPVKPAPPPPGTPNLPEELKSPKEVVLHSRAIWSPDYLPTSEPAFSLYYPGYQPLSLHALTRHRLVQQMGAGDGWIDAEHLILTALGADASLHYSSQKPVEQIIKEQIDAAENGKNTASGTELRIWKHRIAIGRDVFFAEAFFGFLFPFCHPSVYVEITKRKPATYGKQLDSLGFYLLKRRFILVQDPAKHFADSSSPIGRQMPIKRARIVTLRSPDLQDPNNQTDSGLAFWPKALKDGEAVSWEIEAEDESLRTAKTTHAELFFASNIVVGQRLYNDAPAPKRTIKFPGTKLAFANEQTPASNLGPQPAASLETHAVTLTSHCIYSFNNLVRRLRPQISELYGFLQNAEQFKNTLESILKSDSDKQFQVSAREQLISWLENLRDLAASAKPAEFPNVLNQFLDEVAALETAAAKIGSSYFHPLLESAEVVIPALKDVLPETPQRTIKLFQDYVAAGINNVQNGVYAKIEEVINTGDKLAQGVKNGIGQPAAIIAGLSREIGAVVGAGEAALKNIARRADNFDIKDAIPDAKLFGVIPLRDLIGMIGRFDLPNINRIELPDKIDRTWEWSTPVKPKDFGILNLKFDQAYKPRLSILSRAIVFIPTPADLAKGARTKTEFYLHGWLGGWDQNQQKPSPGQKDKRELDQKTDWALALNLLNLIEVRFNYIKFDAQYSDGHAPSPKVDPKIHSVEFLGPLKFLEKLQDAFDSLGKLTILPTPDYLQLSNEFELPPISFGVFSMRSMRLTNRLSLPFGSTPLKYSFGFSSFAKPFELSVMGFAGRGFFTAGFSTNGDRELEGSLEFGGSLSFDVGVASGGLYVMAGAYFKFSNHESTLAGYLRAGGNLDVLGLIHATVEFLLMVRYREFDGQSQLHGICTISVSIDLFLFSMDVHITMEKQIAGSQRSPAAHLAAQALRALNNNQPATTYINRLNSDYGTSIKLGNDVENAARLRKVRTEASNSQGRPYIKRKSSQPGKYQFDSPKKWRSDYWDHFAS